MLQHTSHDIVETLSMLPRTQHNLDSFSLNLWFQTVRTCFLSWEASRSWSWVDGKKGPWMPAFFLFRILQLAFLSTGCSREVSSCRIISFGSPLLPLTRLPLITLQTFQNLFPFCLFFVQWSVASTMPQTILGYPRPMSVYPISSGTQETCCV